MGISSFLIAKFLVLFLFRETIWKCWSASRYWTDSMSVYGLSLSRVVMLQSSWMTVMETEATRPRSEPCLIGPWKVSTKSISSKRSSKKLVPVWFLVPIPSLSQLETALFSYVSLLLLLLYLALRFIVFSLVFWALWYYAYLCINSQAGGPFYPVLTGRRDSVRSYHNLAMIELPTPDDHLPRILHRFALKGFNERETVSLLGTFRYSRIFMK